MLTPRGEVAGAQSRSEANVPHLPSGLWTLDPQGGLVGQGEAALSQELEESGGGVYVGAHLEATGVVGISTSLRELERFEAAGKHFVRGGFTTVTVLLLVRI